MINIVFMGTPDFSVATLEKLHNDNDINISYVITKVDTKSERGQKINFSCVKKKAMELGIEILQPEKIKSDSEAINKIKEAKPDFIVVVAYGQILSKEILDIPRCGCINGHASLLPKYRGASPIQSAILAGEDVTGTTSMLMGEGLDDGDILMQKEVNIDKKETSDSLFDKLAVATADIIYTTIKNFDKIKPIKQDDKQMTKSVIIKKEYGKIDFANENALDVERKIRAYNSWPSAYIVDDNIQYKIWDADVCDENIPLAELEPIFKNVYVWHDKMYAKCKDSYIEIKEIQKSGKNKVSAKDFINGYRR